MNMQQQHAGGVEQHQLDYEEEHKRFDEDDERTQFNQQNLVGIMNTGMGAVNRFQ